MGLFEKKLGKNKLSFEQIVALCDEAEGFITQVHSRANLTSSERETLDMACDCLLEIKGEKELFRE